MTIKVIFYKAKLDRHLLAIGIAAWTWLISSKNRTVGPYAHVEIETYSNKFVEELPPVSYCWTSTMRGEDNGTVSRPKSQVVKNYKRWDVCEIEIGEFEYNIMIGWMKNEVLLNKGYSFRDIGKFFGVGFLADPSRNICSEVVNNALVVAGVLPVCGVVSPRMLAYLLVKAGYTIRPMREDEVIT